jgi:mannonate dehydratase
MPGLTIQKFRAILTAPAGINIIVVKVETSEPGLYGLGRAAFACREKAAPRIYRKKTA